MLHDPRLLIPNSLAGEIFVEAARALGSEDVGLRASQATRVVEMGEWGLVLRDSVTVASFLRTAIVATARFNSGQRLTVVRRGDRVELGIRLTPRVRDGRALASDFQVGLYLQSIRLAAGPRWRPTEIHLLGPPRPHAEELAALAERQTHFDAPYTALVFPASVLALRFPRIDLASPPASGAVPGATFEQSCKQVAESLLRLGRLDLASAAEMAQMSERSLQRGLARCGYTFKRLVDSVRFESAARMLDDPDARIVEIASELGYTDSANFTRAFRRWAGVAPSAFRRSADRPASPASGP